MKYLRVKLVLLGSVALFQQEARSLPCITLVKGDANRQIIEYKNTCDNSMQFTVRWFGTKPTHDSIYWMTGNETRDIAMYDLHGDVLKEEKPTFQGGNPGQIDLLQRRVVGVPNTDVLALHNHRQVHTLCRA